MIAYIRVEDELARVSKLHEICNHIDIVGLSRGKFRQVGVQGEVARGASPRLAAVRWRAVLEGN